MRPLPTAPVFSRADALAIGWTNAAFARAQRKGVVLRLRRDQYTAGPLDARRAAIAAVRGCSDAVASDRSAALLLGLPLLGEQPPVPELTVPPRGTGDLSGAHLYRAALREQDVTMIDGTLCTAPARSVVDLARHRPVATAVAAADFALHNGLTTPENIADVLDFCRGWPGHRRAVRSLALIDARAESPLESVSRLVIRWLRLPPPALQQRIRNEYGVIIARLDFYWDEFGVAGEADGRAKFDRDQKAAATWDRHAELDDLGIQLARWGWDTAVHTPRIMKAKIERAFERGQRRAALGLPRHWSVAPS